MNSRDKKAARVILIVLSCIFLFIGIMFTIVSAVFLGVNNERKEKCTGQTEAVVIRMVRESSSSGGGYAPVFSFTVSGKEYVVKENFYSNPPKYSEGDIVDIRYDPDDPRNIYSDETDVFGLITKIFGGIGIGFTAIGAVILITSLIATRNKVPKDEFSEYYQ